MKENRTPLPPSPPEPPGDEEATSLRDSAGLPQPRTVAQARVHLVIGAVGAGKSTFGRQLAQGRGAVRLTLDEWMATLFRPDRPDVGVIDWYVERAARCVEQIWSLTLQLLGAGTDVILEIGLLRRHQRQAFYQRVDGANFDLTIHVLDAARDVRRERVMHRNHTPGPTFSMVVPLSVFEYASDLWEPLDPAECHGRSVSFIRTDAT